MPVSAPLQAAYVATAKEQDKTLSAPRREALARWIKGKRAALGLTQDGLAERWICSQPSISDAETGKGLGIAVIERIADLEKVSIDEMIGRAPGVALNATEQAALVALAERLKAEPPRVANAVTPPIPNVPSLPALASRSDEDNLALAGGHDPPNPKPRHPTGRKRVQRARVPR